VNARYSIISGCMEPTEHQGADALGAQDGEGIHLGDDERDVAGGAYAYVKKRKEAAATAAAAAQADAQAASHFDGPLVRGSSWGKKRLCDLKALPEPARKRIEEAGVGMQSDAPVLAPVQIDEAHQSPALAGVNGRDTDTEESQATESASRDQQGSVDGRRNSAIHIRRRTSAIHIRRRTSTVNDLFRGAAQPSFLLGSRGVQPSGAAAGSTPATTGLHATQVVLKIAAQETTKLSTVPNRSTLMPNLSLHSCQAYHAQLPENVRILDFDAVTTPSRNLLTIFRTDFRLRAAVSGHYDLRDSLEVDRLMKKLHAGGLKRYHPSYDQTVEILLVLGLPPGVVLHSAPQLIVSRRQDPVLNRGWEQIMRLHAVGWKRKSASKTIMFAPAIRIRYLGESAGQSLRFDLMTHLPKSFLETQAMSAALPQKPASPRLLETSSDTPAVQTCCDALVRESYSTPAMLSTWAKPSLERVCVDGWRLLGDGVECHLCEIVKGTAAAALLGSALPSCYTRIFSNCDGDSSRPTPLALQLFIRAQVFQRQPNLSYVRVQVDSGKNKLESGEACWSDGSQLPRQPASPPQGHDTKAAGRSWISSCVHKHGALLVAWETKEREELQHRIHELTNQNYHQRNHGTRFDCWLRAWRSQALQLFGHFVTLETDNGRVHTLDSVSFAALFERCGNLRDLAPSSAGNSDQHHLPSYLENQISRDMAEQIVREVLFSKVDCAYHVIARLIVHTMCLQMTTDCCFCDIEFMIRNDMLSKSLQSLQGTTEMELDDFEAALCTLSNLFKDLHQQQHAKREHMGSTLDGKPPAGFDEWQLRHHNKDGPRIQLNRFGAQALESLAFLSGPSQELRVPSLGAEWAGILAPLHVPPRVCSRCAKEEIEGCQVACKGCQVTYCSIACSKQAWSEGHRRHCLGTALKRLQPEPNDVAHNAAAPDMLSDRAWPSRVATPDSTRRRPHTARSAKASIHYSCPKIFRSDGASTRVRPSTALPQRHAWASSLGISLDAMPYAEMLQEIQLWEKKTLGARSVRPDAQTHWVSLPRSRLSTPTLRTLSINAPSREASPSSATPAKPSPPSRSTRPLTSRQGRMVGPTERERRPQTAIRETAIRDLVSTRWTTGPTPQPAFPTPQPAFPTPQPAFPSRRPSGATFAKNTSSPRYKVSPRLSAAAGACRPTPRRLDLFAVSPPPYPFPPSERPHLRSYTPELPQTKQLCSSPAAPSPSVNSADALKEDAALASLPWPRITHQVSARVDLVGSVTAWERALSHLKHTLSHLKHTQT
jgi:hypothetical protein